MEKIIAYCGLVCNNCPAFIATENNDENQKKKLAAEWTRDEYEVKAEDINCQGCSRCSEKVFKFCRECEIRQCGIERDIENCAHCEEYPCDKLNIPFEGTPENKKVLDEIRENRRGTI